MQCRNCGVDLVAGAAFCASCGKPAVQPVVGIAVQGTGEGLEPHIAGLLCYAMGFITGVIFLLLEPYKRSPFIRFHAFQAVFLSLVGLAAYFVLAMVSAILPTIVWPVTWTLGLLLELGFFLLWLFLMYKAYNREQFKFPVIGDLAAKQA
jgi:uncharacterized membrane protein